MEAVTEREAMEEYFLLACFQRLVQLALLYNQGLLAQRWHHPQWTGLSHINLESRKCHTDFPKGQSDGGNSSTAGPSSPVTLICGKTRASATQSKQIWSDGF